MTIDDISGKTPNKNKYKTLVARHHAKLRAHGSSFQPSISFACLDSPLRFVNSQHFDMIQAADLISYNIQRQFRDHGEDWEQPPADGGSLPMYDYFLRISTKFRTGDGRRVQGFGIVKAPMLNRVNWSITPMK